MRRNVLQEITLFSYIRIRAGASPTALSLRVSQSEQLLLYTYVSFVHPESFGSRKKNNQLLGSSVLLHEAIEDRANVMFVVSCGCHWTSA